MSTTLSAPDSPAETRNNLRLWVEFATAAVAWLGLGSLNSVVGWLACVHQEPLGGPSPNPGARIAFFVLWILTFGIAAGSGVMSYRSWRKRSQAANLLSAEARERKEYMSLCGLFMSVTLGFGFLWMCLPLFILKMCLRTR